MRVSKTINYVVKNGDNFRVKVFAIDKTRLNSITYQITTWALHHTDNVQYELTKVVKKCRIKLFQNLDMNIFEDDYICVNNISIAKPISKQTSLIIEFTLFLKDEFQKEFIEYKFKQMTEKMNDVFQDDESFSFSQNKHKLEHVY